MTQDKTQVSSPRPRSRVREAAIGWTQREIMLVDARLAGIEAAMSVDMLHGLTNAEDITKYGAMHAEHARLLHVLAAAQDALRQLLA